MSLLQDQLTAEFVASGVGKSKAKQLAIDEYRRWYSRIVFFEDIEVDPEVDRHDLIQKDQQQLRSLVETLLGEIAVGTQTEKRWDGFRRPPDYSSCRRVLLCLLRFANVDFCDDFFTSEELETTGFPEAAGSRGDRSTQISICEAAGMLVRNGKRCRIPLRYLRIMDYLRDTIRRMIQDPRNGVMSLAFLS